MKKTGLLIALLAIYIVSFSQGVLKAKLTESGSSKPLEFANIQIEGTTLGGITDEKGEAEITDIPAGTYNIKLSCIGYQPKSIFEIEISKGKPAVVVTELSPTTTELKEVEVKANPFVKNEESPVSVRTIGTNEIQRYPGGNRDISRVIQSLPGVGFSAGFRNDILVRGGSPSENRFYLDGIEIPNINHFATQGASGGPTGLINVDFIREVNFYSSAFPVNRGNALSSVMDIRLRDGRDDRWGGTFTIGSSEIAASMESPMNKKKTATLLASVRYSYLQFLFKALKLPFLPTYSDAQMKIKWKIKPNDELVFLSLSAYDLNRLNTKQNETESQRYLLQVLPEQNQLSYMMGLKYSHFFENSSLQFFLSRNMLVNEFNKWQDNDKSKTKITDYKSTEAENKFRVEYTGRKKGLRYNVGANYEFARYTNHSSFFDARFTQPGLTKVDFTSKLLMHKFGAFANISQNIEDIVQISAGLRLDGNDYNKSMLQFWNQVSPRLAVSVNIINNLRFNMNAGYYHQLPAYTVLGYMDSTNTLENKDRMTYMRNVHAVAGFEYTTPINSRISIEGFYKRYYNVPFMLDNNISIANQGAGFGVVGNGPAKSTSDGRSYGLELLYEQKLYKGFYGILSYTLFWSQFKDANEKYVSSTWDTRNIISLTIGKKFKKNWELGLRARFQGGSPYTPVDVALSTQLANYNPSNPGILDYNSINSVRTKWFNAADIRVTKKWYFKKWSFELYLDVQNFYAAKAPTAPTFLPITDATTGQVLLDANDPTRIQYKFINTASGTVVPTLGFVIYY
ncbi:MAG: TonB-dependent receptor [Chitinophagales bacterium]